MQSSGVQRHGIVRTTVRGPSGSVNAIHEGIWEHGICLDGVLILEDGTRVDGVSLDMALEMCSPAKEEAKQTVPLVQRPREDPVLDHPRDELTSLLQETRRQWETKLGERRGELAFWTKKVHEKENIVTKLKKQLL